MTCDLCGNAAACLQKEFEGRELDICEVCWCPLAENLVEKRRAQAMLDDLEEYEETTI
jgi:ribosome-binding protein aMBF1 (putative translation factor)